MHPDRRGAFGSFRRVQRAIGGGPIFDCQAKLVITADGGFRRGSIVPLKKNVDDALAIKDAQGNLLARTIEKVIVLRRTGHEMNIAEGAMFGGIENCNSRCRLPGGKDGQRNAVVYSLHERFDGQAEGHTAHDRRLFAVGEDDDEIRLRSAGGGCVLVHCGRGLGDGAQLRRLGPLANGVTSFMYEGAPNYPGAGPVLEHRGEVRREILYTAPTAIRAFMKWGDEWPEKHDLIILRLLGTVGEPINPEAWMWYREDIGDKRCPIVDTWWQTETGGIMITPLPGATPTKPGSATLPFFGVEPEVVDDRGKPVPKNSGGKLVIRKPWPGMLRGVWGDPQRFKDTYWSEVKGSYFTGDGCRQDKDGYYWIVGRIDDVLNVAGHRIGTAEVESALVSNQKVAEAAVVGRADDLKGQALVAFVTVKGGITPNAALREELRNHVAKEIGPVAKPDDIRFAEALPKTRSGKIMRRFLKQIAAGGEIKGDSTTLEDFNVLAKLSQKDE